MIFYVLCCLASATYLIPKAFSSETEEPSIKPLSKKRKDLKSNHLFENPQNSIIKPTAFNSRPQIETITQTLNEKQFTQRLSKSASSQKANIEKQPESQEINMNSKDAKLPFTPNKEIEETSDISPSSEITEEYLENSTLTTETASLQDEQISVYQDLINSKYYIYILPLIILLAAIFLIYFISQCCNRIQACIQNKDDRPILSTDDSELGFITLE